MKQKRILLFASMALLMFGCKAQTSANEQAAVVTAPVVTQEAPEEKLSASQLLEPKLKKDMPYADLRKIVLEDGWLPLVTPECKENVGGEATICNELPELDACSGDGHCVMWFAEGAAMTQLRIDTYGDYRHWNIPGRENELNIKSWEFASTMADTDKTACPAQTFEDFFRVFAGDKHVQASFTSPYVKVTELIDSGEEGYSESASYVAKSDYKDFVFTHKKGGFYIVDSAGELSPQPVEPEIKSESKNSYLVRVPFGTEGSSYRFRNQNGCWYLTEDPETSSP